MSPFFARLPTAVASSLVATLLCIPAISEAAKVTDCAKVGLCYCIDDAHKTAITGALAVARTW